MLVRMIRRLDALIQAAVNAVSFALMRCGVNRSLQFYGLFGVALVVGALKVMLLGTTWPWRIFYTFLAVVWIPIMTLRYRLDRKYEDAGMRTPSFDEFTNILKIVTAIMLASVTFAAVLRIGFKLDPLTWLAQLIQAYLTNTPPRPPPRKEPEVVSSRLQLNVR